MTVTSTTTRVRPATAADAQALAGVLARAFHDDPAGRWFFPAGATRARGLERMFGALILPPAIAHGQTYTTEGLGGAALWTPPGASERGGMLAQLRGLAAMARIWGRDVRRAMRGFALLDEMHPHEPHHYLGILGVSPELQGRGIGSALMQPVLERCDRDGMPAYLEATTPRNRALYERHGFRVVLQARWPDGGPPLWPMWRDRA